MQNTNKMYFIILIYIVFTPLNSIAALRCESIFTNTSLVLADVARLQIQIQYSNIQERVHLLDKFNHEVKNLINLFGSNILKSKVYQEALKKELSKYLKQKRSSIRKELIRKNQISEMQKPVYEFGDAKEVLNLVSNANKIFYSRDASKIISIQGHKEKVVSVFDRKSSEVYNYSLSLEANSHIHAIYIFKDNPNQFIVLIQGNNQSKVESRIIVFDMKCAPLKVINFPHTIEFKRNYRSTEELPNSKFIALEVEEYDTKHTSMRPSSQIKFLVLDLTQGVILHTRTLDADYNPNYFIYDNTGEYLIGTQNSDKFWVWDYIRNKQFDYFDLQSTHYLDVSGKSSYSGYTIFGQDLFNNLYFSKRKTSGLLLKTKLGTNDLGTVVEGFDTKLKIDKSSNLAIYFDQNNSAYKFYDITDNSWSLIKEFKDNFLDDIFDISQHFGFLVVSKVQVRSKTYNEIKLYDSEGIFADKFRIEESSLFLSKVKLIPETSELIVEMNDRASNGIFVNYKIISIPIKDLAHEKL